MDAGREQINSFPWKKNYFSCRWQTRDLSLLQINALTAVLTLPRLGTQASFSNQTFMSPFLAA